MRIDINRMKRIISELKKRNEKATKIIEKRLKTISALEINIANATQLQNYENYKKYLESKNAEVGNECV